MQNRIGLTVKGDWSRMTTIAVVRVCSTFLTVVLVAACSKTRPSGAVALNDPCAAVVPRESLIHLDAHRVRGRVRKLLELVSDSPLAQVGIVTDSGTYIGVLGDDTLSVRHRLSDSRPDYPYVGDLRAISRASDGSIRGLDGRLLRVVRWDSSGALVSIQLLPSRATVDHYVLGPSGILAVTSKPGRKPYTATTGELWSLNSQNHTDSLVATFPALVVHPISSPSAKYIDRPLEHQPIVRWSVVDGWVIASTDSLDIRFGSEHNHKLIAGDGARGALDSAVRDSGITEYVGTTGMRGPAVAAVRAFATSLFRGRTRLQLVDDVIPLLDGKLAVRRMHYCTGRSGWNVVDSSGHLESVFTTPSGYQPVMPAADGILFTHVRGDSLYLSLLHLAPVRMTRNVNGQQ